MTTCMFPSETHMLDTIAAMRLIMPDVLEKERELAHTKWFAYRFLSPLEATKLFAKFYRDGYKAYVRLHSDIEEAENVHGLSTRIFGEPSRSLTELWRARQRADELRLPYDLLVEFGFEFAGRRKWKNPPRPAQLFGSKASDVAWPLEIAKWLADRLPFAVQRLDDIPQYRVENHRGFPSQDDFRAHLIELMPELNGSWADKLERQCLSRRHLPVAMAIKSVPRGARRNVINHLRSEMKLKPQPTGLSSLPDLALAPACFGLPFSRCETNHQCGACPLVAICGLAAGEVTDRMTVRTGLISPVAASRLNNRREKTRKRVQKYRERRAGAQTEGEARFRPEEGTM